MFLSRNSRRVKKPLLREADENAGCTSQTIQQHGVVKRVSFRSTRNCPSKVYMLISAVKFFITYVICI